MSLFDEAQARLSNKRFERLQVAKQKQKMDAQKYPYATYQGKDPSDGTDIVQVGANEPVSGFKLISNAPMAIGDRVALRKNNQGGLQRVDDRNRVVTAIQEQGVLEIFTIVFTFGYDAFGGFVTNVKYSYNTLTQEVKPIGNPTDTTYDPGIISYTAQANLLSLVSSVQLAAVAPPPVGTVVNADMLFTIPNGVLATKIIRKAGGESISTTYDDVRNPIAYEAFVNEFEVETSVSSAANVTINDNDITIFMRKQDTDIDHTPSDNYVLTNRWRFTL